MSNRKKKDDITSVSPAIAKPLVSGSTIGMNYVLPFGKHKDRKVKDVLEDAIQGQATIVANPMLAEEGNLENESLYCRLCESCGHEGCCNFIQCFRKLIENDKCDNGQQYLKDARFHFRISQLSEEVINRLENGQYDAKLAVQEYRKEWNEIYDKVYKAE